MQLLTQLISTFYTTQVPKVRFGKTGLQMPILTLGCMRFQQQWGPAVKNMNMVDADCQDNLVRILKRAICDFGITHIETARAYGCSELQLGAALKQLFDSGLVKREDLIIQTKVSPFPTAKEFRETLEKSLELLQLDYVDLFGIHGVGMQHQYDYIFNNGENGNCIDVVNEFVAAGKIRHVGFSTHGSEEFIRKMIETDAFEYVNLHYHYFGSYTTTGVGPHQGNKGNVELMNEKDMGVFIISAFDKGGKVYQPSNKLRILTLPEMEPMAFATSWLWTHDKHSGSTVHTAVCGAARPSDLDQGAVAAFLLGQKPDETYAKVQAVTARLEQAKVDALGKEWADTCYQGIPKSHMSKLTVEHNQIIWCYNMIKAFGLHQFAKDRYSILESHREQWDKSLTTDENIDKIGRGGWSYTPGLSFDAEEDYAEDFAAVPEANKEKVKEAEAFVHKWCAKAKVVEKEPEGPDKKLKTDEDLVPPLDWQTAYFMKTWVDFPDRPKKW
jgi:predicted aldo/keto reductase-like oxidoreductase